MTGDVDTTVGTDEAGIPETEGRTLTRIQICSFARFVLPLGKE